jgi:hypothetical protein
MLMSTVPGGENDSNPLEGGKIGWICPAGELLLGWSDRPGFYEQRDAGKEAPTNQSRLQQASSEVWVWKVSGRGRWQSDDDRGPRVRLFFQARVAQV